jgi:hypothetical protein
VSAGSTSGFNFDGVRKTDMAARDIVQTDRHNTKSLYFECLYVLPLQLGILLCCECDNELKTGKLNKLITEELTLKLVIQPCEHCEEETQKTYKL